MKRKWQITGMVPAATIAMAAGARSLPSLHVPAEYSTIQAAIDAAPRGSEVVVADGVYSGPGNFNMSFLGKAITVRSENGADQCTIDCRRAGRAFIFNHSEGPDSVLDGFSIINGQGPGGGVPMGPLGGGAIDSSGCSPIIRHCIFRDNATMSPGGFGGAIRASSGAATIEDCLFESNTANGGGAVVVAFNYFPPHPVSMRRCRFIGNQAGSGGAVYMAYDGSANLQDCVISGNTASQSGAIEINWGPSIVMTNTLVTGNNALVEAAVCSAFQGGITANNCTITGNTAPPGRSSFYMLNFGSLTLKNSVVWNEPVPLICEPLPDCGIPGHPTLYALSMTSSIVQGGGPGQGILDVDPEFLDPSRGDYQLAAGSPAIDAGRNTLVPAGVVLDLAGHPRFVDDPSTPDSGLGTPPIVDMGAYEFQLPADLSGDGVVNSLDLGILLSSWSIPPTAPGCGAPGPCAADINGDGFVNSLDLGILLASWSV